MGPSDGFRFHDQTKGASPIVYKRVAGEVVPCFISHEDPKLNSRMELRPKPMIKVFFAADVEVGIVTHERPGSFDVDLALNHNAMVRFSEDGGRTLSV